MPVRFTQVADSLIHDTNWEWGSRTNVSEIPSAEMSLCLLIDIARSLRAIRKGIECHNVRDGFVAMQVAARTLKNRLPAKKPKKKPAAKAKGPQ